MASDILAARVWQVFVSDYSTGGLCFLFSRWQSRTFCYLLEMEKELFTNLASKMGITSARILSQAEEYMRLSLVRCTGLKNTTGTSKAIICLELAAKSMNLPLDKEYTVKLSGLKNKQYQSTLKAIECMLGLDSHLGLRDLAVQFGCMDAVKVATKILERYEASLPAAQQKDVDLSKALFTTAALNAACKCLKIKVDRKLVTSSGAKKGIFDRLCTQLQKLGQDICKEATPLKNPVKMSQKRQNTLMESIEQKEEEEDLPMSQKQLKVDSEKSATEDYEEWKRRILENALKAKQANA
ncbi:origin recognition complex subunit 6 [Oncorhynchus kisutch]|uniref:Origin recognition complex subunit 6 n=1 Tax=Oncorhynchus kisutch TaxID=8019 RepID=A0A8C7IX60_ONCKI|nr:origin recognition complex subunit 6 [Oncorhynchus kisutch]XP_031686606.1 origin recognition complex subunit 6 [Oncorhynchus kisutch]